MILDSQWKNTSGHNREHMAGSYCKKIEKKKGESYIGTAWHVSWISNGGGKGSSQKDIQAIVTYLP